MTALAAAARFELESREKNYPMQVANGKLTADEATIDFQAWHCITGFIETGQFRAVDAGGVDEGTVVDLVLAEAAADRAVVNTGLARAAAVREGDAAKVQRLDDRLVSLRLIFRMVGRHRALMESLNRQLREEARQRAQAVAA